MAKKQEVKHGHSIPIVDLRQKGQQYPYTKQSMKFRVGCNHPKCGWIGIRTVYVYRLLGQKFTGWRKLSIDERRKQVLKKLQVNQPLTYACPKCRGNVEFK